MSEYRIEELSARELRLLYEEHMRADFPEDELRPLPMLLEKQAQGISMAYGWYKDKELYAYAILTQPEKRQPYGADSYVLLDYYAVCRGFRGQGVGSAFLETLLAGLTCKGILFEVEDPQAAASEEERAVRVRRIHFYERLGCRMIEGVQARVFGVAFRILVWSRQKLPSLAETIGAMEQIYHQLLPPELFCKNCFFERKVKSDETV